MESFVLACFYIFAFILVLSLVVVVHEGGHFMVARWCGVRVEEFSLGFGKELCGRTDKKGTRWKICLIPLGGYVKMLGDMDAASAKSSMDKVPKKLRPYTFMAQKLWKRAAIIFAGPATNYVFSIITLGFIIYFTGSSSIPAIITEVEKGSVAEEIGILAGDQITRINDEEVEDWSDISRKIRVTEFGKELTITIDRDGETVIVKGTPRYMEDGEAPRLGVRTEFFKIKDKMKKKDVGFFEAFAKSSQEAWIMTRDTLMYLGQVLFHHRAPREMRGPLGIAEASGDAFQGGPLALLLFIAQISIAVGFMNFLPIPLLDGGHLALYLLEAIRRKPLTEKVQNAAMWVGFSILMGLVGYTFILDIPRIIQRMLE
ncbi:MAG: site-2 protease family protein [Alphaproteobacteria bacterium]|nr:site-2 protease family protein [Alphaproteobacteria bacterium]